MCPEFWLRRWPNMSLQEIENRLSKITPYPWKTNFWKPLPDDAPDEEYLPYGEEVLLESDILDRPESLVVSKLMYDGGYLLGCKKDDTEFLVRAPEDIRFLLDHIAELRAKLEEVKLAGSFARVVLDGMCHIQCPECDEITVEGSPHTPFCTIGQAIDLGKVIWMEDTKDKLQTLIEMISLYGNLEPPDGP